MYAIHTNVGKNRKPLVNTLTNMFGHKPEYAGPLPERAGR